MIFGFAPKSKEIPEIHLEVDVLLNYGVEERIFIAIPLQVQNRKENNSIYYSTNLEKGIPWSLRKLIECQEMFLIF